MIKFLLITALLFSVRPALAVDPDFDLATGFRISRYRAPVPEFVPGGTRVTAADIAELTRDKAAVLIDVMPADGAGADPVTGEWHLTTPRQDISGSIWLPDVGKGALSPAMDSYFRRNLTELTASNLAHAVIVYCQADCWMSWNAVKRASAYGYTSLYWFAEGSDGWRDWDGTFVEAKPVPLSNAGTPVIQPPKP
jgi:PQQ-dependent catabolism-associated CXXCW motif protein